MKEWYLINSNTRPNMLGGYENQNFIDFKDDAFLESLDTDIASTVVLYNYDLSKSKTVRCVVQGNTANTQLKSIERTLLMPIGTARAGMYMFFENRYWLLTGYPGNNKIYEKVTAVLCQYLLKWQNENGNIIERWVNLTSASKYDVGENGNSTITLSSNNYTILMPFDDETIELEEKRVFIDLNTNHSRKVFKLTRQDDPLYYYGEHGAVLSFIGDKTEFNADTDMLVELPDGRKVWIADYHAPTLPSKPDESPILLTITHKGSNSIIAGGNAKTFSALNETTGVYITTDEDCQWDFYIPDEFKNNIIATVTDDFKFKVKVSYAPLIVGETLRIYLKDKMGNEITSMDVKIGGGL